MFTVFSGKIGLLSFPQIRVICGFGQGKVSIVHQNSIISVFGKDNAPIVTQNSVFCFFGHDKELSKMKRWNLGQFHPHYTTSVFRLDDEGIRSSSRYLATVRLEMSTPSFFRVSAIFWSERGFCFFSFSINC